MNEVIAAADRFPIGRRGGGGGGAGGCEGGGAGLRAREEDLQRREIHQRRTPGASSLSPQV